MATATNGETVDLTENPNAETDGQGANGQQHLPDMAPPRIKELDDIALEYHKVVRDRLALQQREKALKDRLRTMMQENDLKTYPIPDTELEVDREIKQDNVKVRQRATD